MSNRFYQVITRRFAVDLDSVGNRLIRIVQLSEDIDQLIRTKYPDLNPNPHPGRRTRHLLKST